jgi:outer membrane protein, heavy metal efflux system
MVMFSLVRSSRAAIRRVATTTLFGATLAWAGGAAAQTTVTRLTASEAIHLALLHNPDSRSADQDVASARGAVTQAGVLPNPSIFISALGYNVSPFQGPIPNQYGVTWTIPIGGKRAASIAAARAGVGAAEATRVATRRQLALSVETAFVNVLLDRSLYEFARQDQQTFRQSVAINELRYKDGKISFGDVLKLRIQARQVDDTVRQAYQQLVNDRAELARLVGSNALAPSFQVVGSLAPPPVPRDLSIQTVAESALRHRADYHALRAQLDAARASLRLARRQPIPDLGVLADYNYVPGTPGTYDLQLTASVPLFDRNQGNVQQAEASYQKARLAIDGLRNQLTSDATRAVEEWRTAEQRVLAYSDDFVKTAKDSLDISRHSYEEGRGTLLDYLDAESSYRDVERAYRSAQAEAVLAAASIRFVSGEDLP